MKRSSTEGSFALVAELPIGLYVAPKAGFAGSALGAGSVVSLRVPKGFPGSALGTAGFAGLNGLESSGLAAAFAVKAEPIVGAGLVDSLKKLAPEEGVAAALGNPEDADALGSAGLDSAGLNAELTGSDLGAEEGVAAALGNPDEGVAAALGKPDPDEGVAAALGKPDDAGALGASSALGADLKGLGVASAAPGALNAELMGCAGSALEAAGAAGLANPALGKPDVAGA